MTVQELIDQLSNFRPELKVSVSTFTDTYYELTDLKTRVCTCCNSAIIEIGAKR
jgi:hypothetical protein